MAQMYNDIDVLIENKNEVRNILNTIPGTNKKYRVREYTIIENKKVFFDLRYVGDGYYCTDWEKDILKTRVFHKKGFFVPNEEQYFYTLLYHGLIHKNDLAQDYIKKLNELGKKIGIKISITKDRKKNLALLDSFMKSKGYTYSEPYDLSVKYNLQDLDFNEISLRRKTYNNFIKLKGGIRYNIKKGISLFKK